MIQKFSIGDSICAICVKIQIKLSIKRFYDVEKLVNYASF